MNFLYCMFFFIIFFSMNMILSANTMNSLLSLILIFFLSSLILLFLGLDYLSLIFISIYVGALSVLFLFIIMMLNIKNFYSTSNFLFYFILFIVSIFFLLIEYLKLKYNFILKFNNLDFCFFDIIMKKNMIYIIGFYLFTKYWLYFFFCGFILLVAIFGSVSLVLEPYKMTKNQIIYYQISRLYNNSYLKVTPLSKNNK